MPNEVSCRPSAVPDGTAHPSDLVRRAGVASLTRVLRGLAVLPELPDDLAPVQHGLRATLVRPADAVREEARVHDSQRPRPVEGESRFVSLRATARERTSPLLCATASTGMAMADAVVLCRECSCSKRWCVPIRFSSAREASSPASGRMFTRVSRSQPDTCTSAVLWPQRTQEEVRFPPPYDWTDSSPIHPAHALSSPLAATPSRSRPSSSTRTASSARRPSSSARRAFPSTSTTRWRSRRATLRGRSGCSMGFARRSERRA